jgi:Asp-tRNA(Asn)/Glu-tRNA(Gln) amidotransferase A subunit family amidase
MGSTMEDCVEGFKALCSPDASSHDSFQAPCVLDEFVYQSILNAENRRPIKIGILQESSHLPYSDSVKRAIAMTEKALKNLGFTVVPFFLTQDVWNSARDFAQSLQTNCLNDCLFEMLS